MKSSGVDIASQYNISQCLRDIVTVEDGLGDKPWHRQSADGFERKALHACEHVTGMDRWYDQCGKDDGSRYYGYGMLIRDPLVLPHLAVEEPSHSLLMWVERRWLGLRQINSISSYLSFAQRLNSLSSVSIKYCMLRTPDTARREPSNSSYILYLSTVLPYDLPSYSLERCVLIMLL